MEVFNVQSGSFLSYFYYICGKIEVPLPNFSLVAGHLTTVRTEGVGDLVVHQQKPRL